MPDELALVDSNVLVYACYQESEHHDAALGLLNRAQDGLINLCLVPQVVAELYAVVTDSRRVSQVYQPDEAVKVVEEILAMAGLTLLPVPGDVVGRWMALVREHAITRGAIFDAQLAATMLGNGVSKIYTFDRSHFERFAELEVLTP